MSKDGASKLGEIENKLQELILKKHKSVMAFAKDIDMPYTTVKGVLSRGVLGASVQVVIKICSALDIDVEALALGNISPKQLKQDTQAPQHEVNPTEDEDPHSQKYQRLNDAGKAVVNAYIDGLLLNPSYQARGADGLTPAERAQAEEIGREMGIIVKEIVDGDDGGPGSLLFGLSQKGKK